MTDFGYWNPYFADNKYPCYVREIKTEKIIYANEGFLKAFDCDMSIVGEKFYDVVKLDDVSYEHIKECLNQGKDYEFGFYHQHTNEYYRGYSHLMRDARSVFCQFKVLIEEDSDLEKALTRCMEIYQQPQEEVIGLLMDLVHDFYQCERAYVHRFDYENNVMVCLAQRCEAPNYRIDDKVTSKEDSMYLLKWIESKSKQNIIVADEEEFSRDHILASIFKKLKVHSIALCPVLDINQQVVGLVGVSNWEKGSTFADGRLLTTIARFVAQDVTKGVIDAALFNLHNRDGLTGLYNRTGYAQEMDKLLESKPKSIGVISININGLKFINENAGLLGGDEHIKASAQKFNEHFDYEFFRMSGDEFLGIAVDVDKEDFEGKVKDLHTLMKKEDDYDFSFGHAWGRGQLDLKKLIFEAETIMYINKQEYYANSERKFDHVTDGILSDLLSYLEDDEFMIYLQPQVRLKDASLYGAEALIRRFDKKNQKMVFPDQFIPLYEQKSVIRHVDIFVVHAVCKLLAEWKEMGKEIPISVNLSRVTLQEYGIVDTIVEICDQYNVPHNLLVIEVTERVGLIENNVASALITAFKDYGFNISLDDFGCAYSNIITLAQIEVDEVKIDKSLVDDLTTNDKNHILVKNMLSMCNELADTSTLAEGIEDEQQAKLLHELGCHLGQGYFYSRPIPVSDFIATYIE